MGYGPDNNKELIPSQIGWVKVPCGQRAEFHFSSNAAFENAICIYPYNSEKKLAERGNYDRKLNDFSTPENNSHKEEWYQVTGWHKNSPPDGDKPWIMSALKFDYANNEYNFGFEDSGGEDYDDMACTVNIVQ
ncbi:MULTISPECIES: hypothetical protein [Bacillus]|uniref:hypothetical protein n=1 Tax=Bacillus TaxID=1386 RepID=UPI0004DB8946|nr:MULTISPECIES: hypothetical protein [Bacillus]AJE78209.1 hypothetical protein OY17_08945 [Bacillus sp. BH072]KMN54711.1 hypothetical protein VK94_12660 [Bacillus sp. LK7]MDY7903194.1 hypothetical protein [Bacillus sp. AG1]ODB73429.1 hypothetical protein A7310_19055 [Bacillus velezensis]QEQ55031.1 hypothetical protein FNS63_19840 [Bacillus amyloliquefaciens]